MTLVFMKMFEKLPGIPVIITRYKVQEIKYFFLHVNAN